MNWISISIIAYLLIALGVIIDKFLLSSNRISHPVVYSFYSGVLSFFTIFVFLPFEIELVGLVEALEMFLFGIIFIYGILLLFFAIKKSEASRVVPVVGVIIPLASLMIESILLGQSFLIKEVMGIIVLIFGGLLISFDLPLKLGEKKFFAGFYYSIFAGTFLAISYSGASYFYKEVGFVSGFSWTRVGVAIGALLMLLIPTWRKSIKNSIFGFKKAKKKNIRTGNLFILNKILNGVGSVLVNYAIAIGSVTLVNALVSVEYVFVFFLALIFHGIYPEIFSEKNKFYDILQKIIAIMIIAAGIFLITS